MNTINSIIEILEITEIEIVSYNPPFIFDLPPTWIPGGGRTRLLNNLSILLRSLTEQQIANLKGKLL